MTRDVDTLTQAVELVAAASWAVDSALRCAATGDLEKAEAVLERAQATIRDGLAGLNGVLEETVREYQERPERLARALESLQELRDLVPSTD